MSIGFLESTDTIDIPYSCGCHGVCSVCTSALVAGVQVGPNWTATISSYTDQFTTLITSAQQAIINALTGTSIHNNINGTYTLTGGGFLGFRGYNQQRVNNLSTLSSALLSAYWDEMATIVSSTCTIPNYASISGHTLSGTASEILLMSGICPEDNQYGGVGSQLEITINYLLDIDMSKTFGGSGYRLRRSLNLSNVLHIDLNTLTCPLNITLDLSTNLVTTTDGADYHLGATIVSAVSTSCYETGAGIDMPLTGSMVVVD